MGRRAMYVALMCGPMLLACAVISGSHNKLEEGKMFDHETDERDLICFQHGTVATLNWDDDKKINVGAEVSNTCSLYPSRSRDDDVDLAVYRIKQGQIVPIHGRLYKLVKFELEDPEIKRRRGPGWVGSGDKACFSRLSVAEPRLDADAVAVTVGGRADFKRDKVELWVERIEMEGGTAVAEVKAYPSVYSMDEAEEEGLLQRKKVRAGEGLSFDMLDYYVEYIPKDAEGVVKEMYIRNTGKVNKFRRKVVSVVAPAANGPIGWIELKE